MIEKNKIAIAIRKVTGLTLKQCKQAANLIIVDNHKELLTLPFVYQDNLWDDVQCIDTDYIVLEGPKGLYRISL